MEDFSVLALHADLLRAVADRGITRPTPIQAQAIPLVLAARDVMGAAQTGTGKTAAFALPVLQRLLPHANHSASPARHVIRALILTPTRELADQVAEHLKAYAKHTPLRVAVVYGGIAIDQQIEQLRRGVEVLIATPGRLLDHMGQKTLQLSAVDIVVLDEADRMLDMGFLPDIEKIFQALPPTRQTLLFSATFSPDIRKLARRYLRDPAEIEISAPNSTAKTVTQVAYQVPAGRKREALHQLVKHRGHHQIIVFVNTKTAAGDLSRFLIAESVTADAIHGDKQQAERNRVLDLFKAGELSVLVATDVAARGLDIAGVPCVINFDVPSGPEDYVHRIGRTGRAGLTGEAISLVSPEDTRAIADIEKLIGMQLTVEHSNLPTSLSSGASSSMAGADRRSDRGARVRDSDLPVRHSSRSLASSNKTPHRKSAADDWFNRPYEAATVATPSAASLSETHMLSGRSVAKAAVKIGALLSSRKKSE